MISRPEARRERLFVFVFLFFVSATMAHSIRTAWRVTCGDSCFLSDSSSVPQTAPEAYRIGLPILQRIVAHTLHLKDGSAADAVIQFACCFGALALLYALAISATQNKPTRVVTLAFFLAFLQLPLAFVLYYQRPETLPTALFLAIALFCVTKSRDGWYWSALLFGATGLQAFARTDVPIVFGLALTVMSLPPKPLAEVGSRWGNLARGLGVVLIAGSVQLYLQDVRFPNLPYSTGSRVVLLQNFHSGHFTFFLLAMLPFFSTMALARTQRLALAAADKIALLTLALYLPLWLTVGVLAEVRIGVPFLLALCPMAAKTSAALLLPKELPTKS